MSDVYTWIAHYGDGDHLAETADRPWAEVDQDRLSVIELRPLVAGFAPLALQVPAGAQGFFTRRRSLEIDLGAGVEVGRQTITIIGYVADGRAMYLYIYPDGSQLLTDRI